MTRNPTMIIRTVNKNHKIVAKLTLWISFFIKAVTTPVEKNINVKPAKN